MLFLSPMKKHDFAILNKFVEKQKVKPQLVGILIKVAFENESFENIEEAKDFVIKMVKNNFEGSFYNPSFLKQMSELA